MNSDQDRLYLQLALQLATQSVTEGGGPFGAVVIKDGQIIGRGHNQVTLINDPTAHAEVIAIRDACKNSQNFDLTACTLYASCEPCPMCVASIYWARISRVVYAATSADAAQAGFDDAFIASELCKPYPQRSIKIQQCDCPNKTQSFELWEQKKNKLRY
jgi:tRNA(Arg) A34 adenosine deaminase TadA